MTDITKFYNVDINNINVEEEFNIYIEKILNSFDSIELFIKNF